MSARLVVMVTIALSVGGCASEPAWKSDPMASARPHRAQNQPLPRRTTSRAHPAPDPTIAEDALLNSLDPRSAEWGIAYAKIQADRDKRLAAKLMICRGCLTVESDAGQTTTSSIHSSAYKESMGYH
jgi:hypothetical protein